ncbi:hypothetical protein COB72_07820 [bacterium]|nr:MAG: hypothetical protein COB72_07820 [bacterium]
MNTRIHALALTCASLLSACAVSNAIGAPIDLTIDPAQSTLNMSIEVDVGIASDTDTDSSSLSGNFEIELDDAGNPASITLNDFMVVIDQPMNYNWSFGFFGSADASLANGTLSYGQPGFPSGPVPVNADAFTFPAIPVALGGLLNVNYNILLVGSGSETVNLGDQGVFDSEFSGTVSVDGETVTLMATLPFNTTQPLTDADGNELGTVTTIGTATIVATGTVPSCPADMNGDGTLNFFDVSAFLNAFAAMDPAADFNGDGEFNFFDVSAFLSAFSAGCP